MQSLERFRGRKAATAACVVAMALGAAGMVMSVVDDSKPVIMRTAGTAAPAPEWDSELGDVDTPQEQAAAEEPVPTSTTMTARRRTSSTTAMAQAAEESDPNAGLTSVPGPDDPPVYSTSTSPTLETVDVETSAPPTSSTPPTTQASAPVVEYPTTTTTTAPAPTWVEVARFEWIGQEPEPLRQSMELTGTGRIRIRTSFSWNMSLANAGGPREQLWIDAGDNRNCAADAVNPGTTIWSAPTCTGEKAFALGQHELVLSEGSAGPQAGRSSTEFGTRQWLVVEEWR